MFTYIRQHKLAAWLLYAGIVLGCLLLLIWLPPPWSGITCGLIAAGSLSLPWVQRAARRVSALNYPRIVSWLGGLLALLGTVAMILSAYYLRPMTRSLIHYRPTPSPEVYIRTPAYWCLGAGVLLLVGALALARNKPRLPLPAHAALLPDRAPHVLPLLAGTVLLLVLAEINGKLMNIKALKGAPSDVQFGLLVAGCGLVAVGLGGMGWSRSWRSLPRREMTLVGALTLAALIVRLWALGTSVRGLVDEGHFAFGATAFMYGHKIPLLVPMPTSASFPYIFSYLISYAVELLGRNFWGLRAVSAVMGALTVPALYLLARHLYDRLTALLAALILMTFPPHLHYSRLALNNIADPLFGTLALAFIARGLQTGRRLDYALGGVALGLTQYFYEGGRLMYPMLAGGWLLAGLILWRPRPPLRGVITVLLAFVIVAVPIYYTLVGIDFPLVDRLEKTQLDEAYWAREREGDTFATRIRHFEHSLAMYVNSPENTFVYYYIYYGGKHPLILEYIVPAFLLGVVIAAWTWRKPGVLPLGWVLLTSVGNAMLVESGVTARYVVAFPALALLIALGLRYTLPLIWPGAWPERLRNGLLIALTLALATAQLFFYFGPFLDHFNFEIRQHVDADVEDALLRSQHFPRGTQIHIVGKNTLPALDAQRFINFLADGLGVDVMGPGEVTQLNLSLLSRTVDHAFYFQDPDTLRALEAVFGPHTLQPTPYDLPRGKSFFLFYVEAGSWE